MGRVKEIKKDDVFEVLRQVYDPDYWVLDKSIIDLGLVREDDVRLTRNRIDIAYDLEASFCVFGSEIGVMIKYALEKKLRKHTNVRLKPTHPQAKDVNRILQSDEEREKLLKRLDCCGVLQQCVRIKGRSS